MSSSGDRRDAPRAAKRKDEFPFDRNPIKVNQRPGRLAFFSKELIR